MSTPHIEEPAHRFDVKADATTHFAWLRTRLAAHPELPRYVALALIGAGTVGLCVSLFEYQWLLRYLWGPD
jgi:hypothetical protein